MNEALKVAVLVDLELAPGAGGHVKTWERLARAAGRRPGDLDLTVFFSGGGAGEMVLGERLRYRFHPPVFSTAHLPFLPELPAHTDLAPFHPGLARDLAGYDVLHTTDGFFAYSRTAAWVARRKGIPLVNSVHTDTPGYSRIYMAETLARRIAWAPLRRFLAERLALPKLAAAHARRNLANHQRRAAFVLGSTDDDLAFARKVVPEDRVGRLRRGVDKGVFHPGNRDRAALAARFGIPEDRTLVLFAGRLSPDKNVRALAAAVRDLLGAGFDLHLLCAGEGPDRGAVQEMLGDRVSCPGYCAPEAMPRLQASADLFVLPAAWETWGNVVGEAVASGVPAVVPATSGARFHIRDGETGLIAAGAGSGDLAAAMRVLLDDPERGRAMGLAGRDWAERHFPSWDDVLGEDLIPVWRRVAGRE